MHTAVVVFEAIGCAVIGAFGYAIFHNLLVAGRRIEAIYARVDEIAAVLVKGKDCTTARDPASGHHE